MSIGGEGGYGIEVSMRWKPTAGAEVKWLTTDDEAWWISLAVTSIATKKEQEWSGRSEEHL